MIPNNRDAAFKTRGRKPRPSDLLLHYNYGAAAVKWWGHGIKILHDRFDPPHPSEPVPAPLRPPTEVGNRTIARDKFDKARKDAEAERRGSAGKRRTTKRGTVQAKKVRHGVAPATHEFSPAETGSGEEKLGERATWDEDDVILFLWGNTQVAKDRHSKKIQDEDQRMERWKNGLSYV